MADLHTLVKQMGADGTFTRITANPLAQFGTQARTYLGAQLLPEQLVPENMYVEDQITYRTVIANDGTRYSPVQKKGSALIGSFKVDLGHSDIGSEFTGRHYDALIKLLATNGDMNAVANIIRWADVTLNQSLLDLVEKQRWQAIVNASVVRLGDNNYTETVSYPNPTGHRVTPATPWSTDAYDPFSDIFAIADLLYSKGFMVSRIITSRQVVSILGGNDKVKTRTNRVVVSPTGQISGATGRAEMSTINGVMQADGLPAMELYDLQYRTQLGTERFLPADCMVFVCSTGRDANIDLGDNRNLPIANTLGYSALGTVVGQSTPGRVMNLYPYSNKPPRIEGEAYQATLPVIVEPEAIAVITGIS